MEIDQWKCVFESEPTSISNRMENVVTRCCCCCHFFFFFVCCIISVSTECCYGNFNVILSWHNAHTISSLVMLLCHTSIHLHVIESHTQVESSTTVWRSRTHFEPYTVNNDNENDEKGKKNYDYDDDDDKHIASFDTPSNVLCAKACVHMCKRTHTNTRACVVLNQYHRTIKITHVHCVPQEPNYSV